jgi:hypothetical protein
MRIYDKETLLQARMCPYDKTLRAISLSVHLHWILPDRAGRPLHFMFYFHEPRSQPAPRRT